MTELKAPNVGNDPINPAYYAGTTCAEIIEHMPTNVGFACKYAWRLGEKDSAHQESGKAIWYLKRELIREPHYYGFPDPHYQNESHKKVHAAFHSGKLEDWRARVVSEGIAYTVSAEPEHLSNMIRLFEENGLNNESKQ